MVQVTLVPLMVATTTTAYILSRRVEYPPLVTMAVSWAVALFLYLVVWLSWLFPFYVSELRHVPTVPGFPLWGQFWPIVGEECGVPQRRWHRQHGAIIRYFFPFGAERLSVADDDALRHMTLRNPYNYPKPERAKLWMVRILGEGVLLAEGAEHVHQRKALAPAFSVQSIRALAPVFWNKALLLARCWREDMAVDAVECKTYEVLDWLNRTTLDIIGQAGFGYDVDSLRRPNTPLREAYRLVFAFDFWSHMLHGLQSFIPASKHMPAKMNRDMETARAIIVDKATEIIHEKQHEADTGARDIMALIMRDNKELQAAGERGLSPETMRDQIMTFLGAGHDTTATGVAWTLHLLSTHPEVQARLRNEIRDRLPFLFAPQTRSVPAADADADADRLPYLDKVCRESLRYIPPIPLTVRQTLAADTLGGYHVPAGTIVYILANAIHRLPHFWGPDADRFDPDRWEDAPPAQGSAFMAFLQGPRGCIGRKFAETEMKILLCVLLSAFEFERDEACKDPELWKMWRLVLRPKEGVSLRVTAI